MEQHANLKHGNFTACDKYLVEKSFWRFNVHRFQDLLWAYKHVTQRRMYYVIPAGKYYHAILIFYGGSAQIPMRENDVDATLLYAAKKAPWAVIGYSKELSDLFNNNTQQFCAAIEARRRELRTT